MTWVKEKLNTKLVIKGVHFWFRMIIDSKELFLQMISFQRMVVVNYHDDI